MDNDDIDDCTIMCNSVLHRRVARNFTIAGSVSGTLSIIGSSLIIFIILRRRSLSFFRNRIIFMLSIFDVINSLALAFFTLASPPEDAWGRPTIGIGNRGTCIAQGFAVQMGGTVVPAYNAILCCYYRGVIQYSQEDSELAKKYERLVHPTALFLPLCSAIMGCAKELFNSNGRICWFQMTTTDSSDLAFILICLTAFWNFMSCVVINVSMLSTYRSVRKTNDSMTRYRFPGGAQPSMLCCKKRNHVEREVATTYRQALFFFFGHTTTYIWTAISLGILMTSYLTKEDPPLPLELEFLQALFLPLQGLWNFVAFVHPRFLLMKAENPELGFLSILMKVILDKSQLNVPVIRSLPTGVPTMGGSLPNMPQNQFSHITQQSLEVVNVQESKETYLQGETTDHNRSPQKSIDETKASPTQESQCDATFDAEQPPIENSNISDDEEDLKQKVHNGRTYHSQKRISFESMAREEITKKDDPSTPRRHSLPNQIRDRTFHENPMVMNYNSEGERRVSVFF